MTTENAVRNARIANNATRMARRSDLEAKRIGLRRFVSIPGKGLACNDAASVYAIAASVAHKANKVGSFRNKDLRREYESAFFTFEYDSFGDAKKVAYDSGGSEWVDSVACEAVAYFLATQGRYPNLGMIINTIDKANNKATHYWMCHYYLRNVQKNETHCIDNACFMQNRHGYTDRTRADYAMIAHYRGMAERNPNQWEFVEVRETPRTFADTNNVVPDPSDSMSEYSIVPMIDRLFPDDTTNRRIGVLMLVKQADWNTVASTLGCSKRRIKYVLQTIQAEYIRLEAKNKRRACGV